MGFEAGIGVWGVIVALVVFLTLVRSSFRFLVLFALKRVFLQRYLSSWFCLRLFLALLMNNSFELCKNHYLEIQIAQMNYSWAMSKAVLDKTKNSINAAKKTLFKANKTKNLKEDRTSVKKTTRATMTPQTPIPASNPILASMPNIYLKLNELKLIVKFIIKSK